MCVRMTRSVGECKECVRWWAETVLSSQVGAEKLPNYSSAFGCMIARTVSCHNHEVRAIGKCLWSRVIS